MAFSALVTMSCDAQENGPKIETPKNIKYTYETIAELPNLKKLMFENVNCNRSDFIKFSTKLSMSTKLKYLLFYDVNCLDEDIFGTI